MMKKYILTWIMCLWLCVNTSIQGFAQITATTQQTFNSKNAKTETNVSYKDMLYLDYGKLFKLNTDLSGGIIGDVSAGGEIRLKVFAFDDSKSDGKGALVYGAYIDANSSTFTGKTWDVLIDVYADEQIAIPIYAKSTDIKKLIQKANLYIPGDNGNAACKSYEVSLSNAARGTWNIFFNVITFGGATLTGQNIPLNCEEFYKTQQPVVVEVTVKNATFKKFKVPGLGEYEAAAVFGPRNFTQVNGNVAIACHRGYWEDITAPENTYNAIGQAITRNYDIIELDMWTTSDNTVIVFHDMGLNKRTTQTGAVKTRTWGQISGLNIKNRFDELISTPNTQMVRLEDVLNYIKTTHPTSKIWLNLDRSANDMADFKRVYTVVKNAGLLGRAIFKGRYNPTPAAGELPPNVVNIRQAFQEMFPTMTQTERDNEMKLMFFTPVFFDNAGTDVNLVKTYIDDMIAAGLADGFEMTFKAKPVGSADYAIDNDSKIFLLKSQSILGNKTFVQYVKDKGFPVGIFASVPEVGAIPNFNTTTDGSRNPNDLVSGFVKEDASFNYNPKVTDQSDFDFRGDWDFYIPAGADYVITDRPDALLVYLKAILKHN